jgi:hypothetical protein
MSEEQEDVVERDYEAEATKEGWNADYDGANAKTAQEFVESGEKIAGIAVSKARKLEKTVEGLNARLETMESTKAEFVDFNQRALAKERQEKDKAIAELKAERSEAISEGDGQRVTMLEDKLEEAQAAPQVQPGQEPWAREWASENPWYATDHIRRGAADGIANQLRQMNFPDTGKNFMDEVSRQVREAFPAKFENPNRKQGITNGDGTKTDETAPKGERSFDALPSDAQAACDRFVAEGLMTKKDYLATYDWA